MSDKRLSEDREDIPSDFFDDFQKEDFMDGLSVIDSWGGDEQKRKSSRIDIEALDAVSDLRELIENKDDSTRSRRRSHEDRGSKLDDYIKPGSRRDPNKTNEAIRRDKEIKVKEYLAKSLEASDDLRPPGTELDDYYDEAKMKEANKHKVEGDTPFKSQKLSSKEKEPIPRNRDKYKPPTKDLRERAPIKCRGSRDEHERDLREFITKVPPQHMDKRRHSPYSSPRLISPRHATPRHSPPRRISPRQTSTRRISPRRISPHQTSTRRISPRHVSPRRISPRHASKRRISPHHGSPRRSSPRHLSLRHASPRRRRPSPRRRMKSPIYDRRSPHRMERRSRSPRRGIRRSPRGESFERSRSRGQDSFLYPKDTSAPQYIENQYHAPPFANQTPDYPPSVPNAYYQPDPYNGSFAPPTFEYGAPAQGFGPPTPAPAQSFGPPTPAPAPGFGPPTPAPGFGPPTLAPGFGPPTPGPGFGPPTPAPGFGPPTPSPGFGPPTPAPGFGSAASVPGFGPTAPAPGFGPPAPQPQPVPAPMMPPMARTPTINPLPSPAIVQPTAVGATVLPQISPSLPDPSKQNSVSPFDALAKLVAEGKLSKEDYLKLTPNKGKSASIYCGFASSSSVDAKTRVTVLNRCNEALSKLTTLRLPNALVLSGNLAQEVPKEIAPKYCSPLKRQFNIEYIYTSSEVTTIMHNNKQLIESIVSALGLNNLMAKSKRKGPKNMSDAATQTTKPYCDVCDIRNATNLYDTSTMTDPRYFTSTIHTQVVEQDLMSSKAVFAPSGSLAGSGPISIAHLTPAQLVSQLAARAKSLKEPGQDAGQTSGPSQYRRPQDDYDRYGRGSGGGGGGRGQYQNYNNYRY